MECPPVVILPFARTDKFARVLQEVRRAAPPILVIGSDGPRPDNEADADAVAAVRRMVDEEIDWACDVRRVFHSTNVGVQANAELTLDSAFTDLPHAIVFDDDCVPHPSFFRYCAELLQRYADDSRVMHIAGCNEEMPAELFDGYSYAFTTWGSNWGWATWARAWHAHRRDFPRPHDETTTRVPYGKQAGRSMPLAGVRPLAPRAPSRLVTASGRRFFGDVAAGRDLSLSEWGQQLRLSMINQGGLSVTPAANLIENVGFGEGSDSNMPERDMQRANEMTFPLVHPPAVEVNEAVQRVLERNIVRAVGRLARAVRQRSPESLRAVLRRASAAVVPGSSLR